MQGWDRYAYVNNNPLRYTDPSGHEIACGNEISASECKKERRISKANTATDWKRLIKGDFGITMSDNKHNWDVKNLILVYFGLEQIDSLFGGKIKSIVGDSVFQLDGNVAGHYSGYTQGRTITFYTGTTVPEQNLYHEFGHLLDNIYNDTFTNSLRGDPHVSKDGSYLYGGDNLGIINSNATLKNPSRVGDPNWVGGIDSLQHPSGDPVEQWADMLANYVAGNIDLSKTGGAEMYGTVNGYLGQVGLLP